MNDHPALIAEYKRYRKKIGPEITKSINDEGVPDLEIYPRGTRMFMMLEADDSFSLGKKAEADRKNPKVQEWEELRWRFRKAWPDARPGEKVVLEGEDLRAGKAIGKPSAQPFGLPRHLKFCRFWLASYWR